MSWIEKQIHSSARSPHRILLNKGCMIFPKRARKEPCHWGLRITQAARHCAARHCVLRHCDTPTMMVQPEARSSVAHLDAIGRDTLMATCTAPLANCHWGTCTRVSEYIGIATCACLQNLTCLPLYQGCCHSPAQTCRRRAAWQSFQRRCELLWPTAMAESQPVQGMVREGPMPHITVDC